MFADGCAAQEVASSADGFSGWDLQALLQRALHAGRARRLAAQHLGQGQGKGEGEALSSPLQGNGGGGAVGGAALQVVAPEDWEVALRGFEPASAWAAQRAVGGGGGPSGWEDVGGMTSVKQALQESLEMPLRCGGHWLFGWLFDLRLVLLQSTRTGFLHAW